MSTTSDPTSSAQQLFDESNDRSMRGWRSVISLMLFSDVSKDPAKEKMLAQALSVVDSLETLAKKDVVHMKTFAADMTNTIVGNALAAVGAAGIVFGHAVMDTTMNDLLRVTSYIHPDYWTDLAADEKTVWSVRELHDLREVLYPILIGKGIDTYVKKLTRQSLPNRVDILNQCCRQFCKVPADPIPGYVFDLERIKRFDKIRHEIIHGAGLTGSKTDARKEVGFMRQTNAFFIALVQCACQLKVDLNHWLSRSVR